MVGAAGARQRLRGRREDTIEVCEAWMAESADGASRSSFLMRGGPCRAQTRRWVLFRGAPQRRATEAASASQALGGKNSPELSRHLRASDANTTAPT